MKIEFGTFETLNLAEQTRRAEWRERSVRKINAARAWRLEELKREREGIARAVDAYGVLDRGDVPTIVIRSRFACMERARSLAGGEDDDEPQDLAPAARARARRREIASRPPLTRLVHRATNALAVYLTAVYVGHLEAKPGHAVINSRHNTRTTEGARKSWSLLAGLTAPRDIRTRRARMRRALDELVTAQLVNIQPPGARYRYEKWVLLRDDGSESQYVVPSEREAAGIRLPATFFLNGWHLVLAPGEIAMLLAIIDRARVVGVGGQGGEQRWTALPQSVRRDLYGLSGEVYLHAQQLHEFGLIDLHDPMINRRRGKIFPTRLPPQPPTPQAADEEPRGTQKPPPPVPYLFSPPDMSVFDKAAFTVVHDTLSALSLPYRLDDQAELLKPQDWVQFQLEAKRQSR